jgi:hypothetical protein
MLAKAVEIVRSPLSNDISNTRLASAKSFAASQRNSAAPFALAGKTRADAGDPRPIPGGLDMKKGRANNCRAALDR